MGIWLAPITQMRSAPRDTVSRAGKLAMTYRDSLPQYPAGEEEKYRLMLANALFAGSLDYESCARDLQPFFASDTVTRTFEAVTEGPDSIPKLLERVGYECGLRSSKIIAGGCF
jgi:hypothetical protein